MIFNDIYPQIKVDLRIEVNSSYSMALRKYDTRTRIAYVGKCDRLYGLIKSIS